MRRYRAMLYLEYDVDNPVLATGYDWDPRTVLKLPHGELSAAEVRGSGIKISTLGEQPLQIRFRRGGERCHPSNRAHSQSLKRLLQEWGVPPWQRFTLPLIYRDEALVAVSDLCVSKAFAAKDKELAYRIRWRDLRATGE